MLRGPPLSIKKIKNLVRDDLLGGVKLSRGPYPGKKMNVIHPMWTYWANKEPYKEDVLYC